MRFLLRWCVLAEVLVAASSGCGDSFGLDDVVGEWETTTINGQAVPGTVVLLADDYDMEYWHWIFESGGQCSAGIRYSGESVSVDNCEYSVDITQQTITGDSDGLDFAGTVNGDRMDLHMELFGNFVLRRR